MHVSYLVLLPFCCRAGAVAEIGGVIDLLTNARVEPGAGSLSADLDGVLTDWMTWDKALGLVWQCNIWAS